MDQGGEARSNARKDAHSYRRNLPESPTEDSRCLIGFKADPPPGPDSDNGTISEITVVLSLPGKKAFKYRGSIQNPEHSGTEAPPSPVVLSNSTNE
jgi:hypothetical protein